MIIEVLKSKIHRVRITHSELNYIGSITIDENLMEAANIIENEKVQVVNLNNGERLETYVIKGERGSGSIGLNGAAARKALVGDTVIIISYCSMDFEKLPNGVPLELKMLPQTLKGETGIIALVGIIPVGVKFKINLESKFFTLPRNFIKF